MTRDEKQKLLGLPAAERLELAQLLWRSLEEEVDNLPLTLEQEQVLEERLAAFRADPEDLLSWEDVRARLLAV